MPLKNWNQLLEEIKAISPFISWSYVDDEEGRVFSRNLRAQLRDSSAECRLFASKASARASHLWIGSQPDQLNGHSVGWREAIKLIEQKLK